MKMRPLGAELFSVDGRTERQMERHDEANTWYSLFEILQIRLNRIAAS
jgi:hypothetical protein